ncbi:ATP6V0A1 [Symbiodinium sp. CCMP2592]|nr:ATP6V0A1 [Symbiodinium sp. CCMP2592]
MDPSWQEDARRAVRMGLLLAERSIHALLPPAGLAEADAGHPSTGTAAPLSAPQALRPSTPAGLPRPPRWPVRAPSPLEPDNPGLSPRPAVCRADSRNPLRVRPQRARVRGVTRAGLASAHTGHPSARARPAPHPHPVRADPDRYRPAPPRLATGAIGAATLDGINRDIAGGPPSPRARAGSGPPPARSRMPSSRTSLPRGGRGPSRSRSIRRTPNTRATPSKPGLMPKRAARPSNGGHASRNSGTPSRPAPLTVFRSHAAPAGTTLKGKAKGKRAIHTTSVSPPSPATVQLAASPKLRLPAGLHIVGLPRRPNLSQLEALLSHVAELSPSLAGLEPSFQLAQTRRSSHKIPAFFLSHAAFAIPGLAGRILEEIQPAAGKDKRGRTKLASPVGTLKISLAQQAVPPALPAPIDDLTGNVAPTNPTSSCPATEPNPPDGSGPSIFKGLRLVEFTAGTLEEGWTCVCCRGDILACDKLVRLECLHVVHSDCLERWLEAPRSRGRCPECNEMVL